MVLSNLDGFVAHIRRISESLFPYPDLTLIYASLITCAEFSKENRAPIESRSPVGLGSIPYSF